jgi:chromosome segregation ATPase
MKKKIDSVNKKVQGLQIALDKLAWDIKENYREFDEIEHLDEEVKIRLRRYRMQSNEIDARIRALEKEIEITTSEVLAIPELREQYYKNIAKMRKEKTEA